ncbi:hypothetical protein M9458_053690 [Cirrhinus mrigala]|uniref:Uncharacterized protein n=1 Tax=Cirrhinus mrigala TaxID=683832 RepID=A0ABD0MPZ6_CIRMR
MAVRSDAAATPGPNDGAFMSFNVVRSSPNSVNVPLKHRESTPKQIYDRQSLLEIGNAHKHQLSPAAIEKLRGLCILLKPDLKTVASPSDDSRTKRRHRQCKRGRKRAYRPLLKLTKPVQTQITVWPDSATSALQDCFQDTDWNMFKEAATYNNHTDLQEYTETVTAYIKKCIDDVTVTKTITTRANQKPWMTAEVHGLLKIRDEAFRSGDKAALKTSRANLSHGIKKAKHQYAQKINNNFSDSKDTRSLWQAIQTITDYKPLPQASGDDTSLPDALNHFYSQFEIRTTLLHRNSTHLQTTRYSCLSPADVKKTPSRINPRKAAGADNIPGRVLRDCAAQLTDVFRHLQHLSEPGSRPHLSQIHIHNSSSKEVTCVLSE